MKFNSSMDIILIISELLEIPISTASWTQEECSQIVALLSTPKIIEDLEDHDKWTSEWYSALENELFERNILAEEGGNDDSK